MSGLAIDSGVKLSDLEEDRALPEALDTPGPTKKGRRWTWGDIVAPPTFPITFRDENADTGVMLRDLGVDISRILHGEQEFEHFKPIRPGETYLCRSRVTDIYEKAGRSGAMAFVVREMTVTDGDNDIACLVRSITVVRL